MLRHTAQNDADDDGRHGKAQLIEEVAQETTYNHQIHIVERVRYENAEDAGYQFEKGRQRAMREANRLNYAENAVNAVNSQSVQPQPKKRRTWLWVLGWIFIFPVPLTILMLRKKDMKPVLKYGIIAAAWIVYLLIAFSGKR